LTRPRLAAFQVAAGVVSRIGGLDHDSLNGLLSRLGEENKPARNGSTRANQIAIFERSTNNEAMQIARYSNDPFFPARSEPALQEGMNLKAISRFLTADQLYWLFAETSG